MLRPRRCKVLLPLACSGAGPWCSAVPPPPENSCSPSFGPWRHLVPRSRPWLEQRLTELRERRASVPGYGHGWHRDGDPRVTRLVQIAREQGAAGSHVEALLLTEKLIPEVFGRTLVANVSGAIPAVMLDCGFPLEALKGISILARTAGILAHLHEEMTRPIGFTMAEAAMGAIGYDGERPAGLRTEGQA